MAVTLRGGSWGDCRPYKLTICCSLRSAHLNHKRRAEALEKNCGNRNPSTTRKENVRELAVAGKNPWAAPVNRV
ncbi:UNVERIFIED_CONTAM: hypothetical protein FKN15_029552 [Acipenser sinensis]